MTSDAGRDAGGLWRDFAVALAGDPGGLCCWNITLFGGLFAALLEFEVSVVDEHGKDSEGRDVSNTGFSAT